MSRSGYSYDGDGDNQFQLYRQAVRRATTGYRGQHLLKKLRAALDAMPTKRLIADAIKNESGEVCALGALDPNAPAYSPDNDWYGDHTRKLATHFNVAQSLTAEIVYMNDEALVWRDINETPEQRWTRMRAWVNEQILQGEPDAGGGER